MESPVLLTRHGVFATLTLNRPARLNAFDGPMVYALADVLETLVQQAGTLRCVLLTGAGRGFCAGADLEALVALRRGNQLQEFRALLEAGRRVVTALREMPVPVLAVVNGAAAGGGGSIAMACDIRLAGEAARFTQAFSKIGVHADFGASFFLPRLIGEAKARELMFSGETITAHEAHRLGLVNQVVAADQLNAAGESLAHVIASRAPLSLRLMKQSLARASREEFRQALDREMEAQLHCFQSEDFRRGIEAFVQKSPVTFEGR